METNMNLDTKALSNVDFRALSEAELGQASGGTFLLGVVAELATNAFYDWTSKPSGKAIVELVSRLK